MLRESPISLYCIV